MNRLVDSNIVTIAGEISSDFEFSHELYGEKFYKAYIKSKRQSGTYDIIPFMVSDRMIVIDDFSGMAVKISGQFRSYSNFQDGKRKVELYIFVSEIQELDDEIDCNEIHLQGCICKEPVYRQTPLGRDIADVLLSVNRPYSKTDYIPCICWGRTAHYVSTLSVGTELSIVGRVQSRDYTKHISDTEFELRTAYEVSISKVEVE